MPFLLRIAFGPNPRVFKPISKRSHNSAHEIKNHNFGVLIYRIVKMSVLPMQKNVWDIDDCRKERCSKAATKPEEKGGGDDRNIVKALVNLMPDDLVNRCQKVENGY